MWPALWGFWYWSLIHCGTFNLKNRFPNQLPVEYQTAVENFFNHLCMYLPCPGCTIHCMRNFHANPPLFTNGTEAWVTMIDFHNSVNKRTNKLELTYDEATQDLVDQLRQFNFSTDRIEEVFLYDWWNFFYSTTHTFSQSLRKGNDATEEEQTRYRQFLKNACYMLPFHQKVVTDSGETCLTVLHKVLDHAEFATRDQAQNCILTMYNSVCLYFQQLPKVKADMTELFEANLKGDNYVNLVRSEQVAVNVNKKYDTLKAQYSQMASDENLVSHDYFVATIVLAVLAGILLLWVAARELALRHPTSWKKIQNRFRWGRPPPLGRTQSIA